MVDVPWNSNNPPTNQILIHHSIIHSSIFERFISCVLRQIQVVFYFLVLDKVSFLLIDHESLLTQVFIWWLKSELECKMFEQDPSLIPEKNLVLFLKDVIFRYLESILPHFDGLSLLFLSLISPVSNFFLCSVDWGCRIHWLLLWRRLRPLPQTSVQGVTLNNLIVRFQWCWSFGECGALLHCYRSHVHFDPEG